MNGSIDGYENIGNEENYKNEKTKLPETEIVPMSPRLIVKIHMLKEKYVRLEALKENVSLARENIGKKEDYKSILKKSIIVLFSSFLLAAGILEIQKVLLHQERNSLLEIYITEAEEKVWEETEYLEHLHFIQYDQLQKLEKEERNKPIAKAYQSALERYLEFKVIVRNK